MGLIFCVGLFSNVMLFSCASDSKNASSTETLDAGPIPEAQIVAEMVPIGVVKPLPKKKGRKFKAVEGRLQNTDAPVGKNEISVQCVVKLPDDSGEHPEICSNFKIVLLDREGSEIARMRFDDAGKARFSVAESAAYTLKPLISKSWRFEPEPKTALKAGDWVRAIFTQRE